MAIAADLPPELFPYILHHVRPSMLEEFGSQEKRGVVRHLASCSLTCLFWAHACRPKIFEAVQVHSIDDLHALSELVVNTPRRLTSISEYIQYAQLVQRLDERSWLHTLSLQPPLGVEVLTSTQTRVEACIVGPSSADLEVGPFTIHRLFADLPRTPPSHLLRCDTLLLQDCHFRTLGDFKRSLLAFYGLVSRQFRLHVVNSTLDNRIRVANGVIAGRPLKLLPCSFSIEARGCSNTVELAWTALACEEQMLCSRSYFIEPLPSLHLSDQRVIYKLSSIMHQSLDQSPVSAELIDTPIFEITIGGRSRFRPLKYTYVYTDNEHYATLSLQTVRINGGVLSTHFKSATALLQYASLWWMYVLLLGLGVTRLQKPGCIPGTR
ncbi:hypothetical protein BC835DRAFT_1392536 [Cytidiella melzeri]|nr:hypothetical protein BC835DRAFT_1392536 [Cytidiella melzeri]